MAPTLALKLWKLVFIDAHVLDNPEDGTPIILLELYWSEELSALSKATLADDKLVSDAVDAVDKYLPLCSLIIEEYLFPIASLMFPYLRFSSLEGFDRLTFPPSSAKLVVAFISRTPLSWI